MEPIKNKKIESPARQKPAFGNEQNDNGVITTIDTCPVQPDLCPAEAARPATDFAELSKQFKRVNKNEIKCFAENLGSYRSGSIVFYYLFGQHGPFKLAVKFTAAL